MSLYAIAAGKLYLAFGARAEVEVRGLFTGKKLPALTLGAEDRRVKWLTVEAGTLFALLGSPAETRRPFAFALQPPVFAKHEKQHTLFGTEIVAWDLGDGRMRWRHEEGNPIDFRTMALNDGRLYFYSETQRLVCLDAGDGKGGVRDNYKMSLSTVGLNMWSKAAFTQEGCTMQTQPLVKAELRFGKPDYNRWTEVFRNLKYDGAIWQKPDLDVSALALVGNAVLAAHATGYEEPRSWNVAPDQQRQARIEYDGWKLTALDRADGKGLWSLPLPAEPLRNGIAVAADGTVVLALRDGTLMAVRS
jgi:hypothetical protein